MGLKLHSSSVVASRFPLLRQPLASEPLSYRLTGYHATSTDNWLSIRRLGLVPGKADSVGQDWDPKWKGKATYFHLSLPLHEIDNLLDPTTGEPSGLVIEAVVSGHSGYFVPDEDVNDNVDYTPRAIKNQEAIAFGHKVPSAQFTRLHLADTLESRSWALKNCKGFKLAFHK